MIEGEKIHAREGDKIHMLKGYSTLWLGGDYIVYRMNYWAFKGLANYRRIWPCYLAFSTLAPKSPTLSSLSFSRSPRMYEVNFRVIGFASTCLPIIRPHYGWFLERFQCTCSKISWPMTFRLKINQYSRYFFFISILLQCSRKSQFKVALTSRFRIACAAHKRFVKLCSKEGVSKAVKSNFLTIGWYDSRAHQIRFVGYQNDSISMEDFFTFEVGQNPFCFLQGFTVIYGVNHNVSVGNVRGHLVLNLR